MSAPAQPLVDAATRIILRAPGRDRALVGHELHEAMRATGDRRYAIAVAALLDDLAAKYAYGLLTFQAASAAVVKIMARRRAEVVAEHMREQANLGAS